MSWDEPESNMEVCFWRINEEKEEKLYIHSNPNEETRYHIVS
jgi:hypothetical protein